MQCMFCGGLVLWAGPLIALTHTVCQRCGAINCQIVDDEQDEEQDEEQEAGR